MKRRGLFGTLGMGFAAAALLACGSGDASGNGMRGKYTQPLNGGVGGLSNGAGGFGDGPLEMARGGAGGARPPAFDPKRCTNVELNASRTTPVVMLVVDGSTSMLDLYGGTTSRWAAVRSALVDPTMGVVPQLQGLVKFGLAVYGTVATCPLPLGVVKPALNNFPAIQTGVPLQPPGTYTPTGLALDQVIDMLPDGAVAGPDVKDVEPQIIVLATDGDPNDCAMMGGLFGGGGLPMANYQPSISAAMKAQAKHQKLFVISVGMDASKAHLQEMANIGAGMDRAASPGAPVFYPENSAELAAKLSELIGMELSCEVKLEGKGVIPGKECTGGTVTLNGTPLMCNGPDGWKLTDALHIELVGAACDQFKKSASARLEANFTCEQLVE